MRQGDRSEKTKSMFCVCWIRAVKWMFFNNEHLTGWLLKFSVNPSLHGTLVMNYMLKWCVEGCVCVWHNGNHL